MKREDFGDGPPLLIEYRNHRGEVGHRAIIPGRSYYGEVPWHRGPQWLLECWDIDRNEARTFAWSGVLRVLPGCHVRGETSLPWKTSVSS